MQIHELPAGTPAAGMSFAGDTGSQTQKIDYDALADAILNKLTTKTFDIKSESQTIIAALNALGDAAKQGVANNLVTTGAGYLLDARQGKALSDLHATNADAIAALNSSTSVTLGSTSYTAQVTYYLKKATKYATNRIHIEITCIFTINMPTGQTIVTVPEGYRPTTTKIIPAIIVTDAGAVMTSQIEITADGVVRQGLTGYARNIYCDAWYDI